ncbi:hypothetical protein ZWY2020_024729 [Hordeum vulgare]|nr:hypothetical protein ZWY2020_024729 [Hordeum vulgare]
MPRSGWGSSRRTKGATSTSCCHCGSSSARGANTVLEPSGKQCASGATLRMSVQYVPVARLTMYSDDVTPGPDFPGVPNTYFRLRAVAGHVPADATRADDGSARGHLAREWRGVPARVYDAMSQATKLIYIIGWSVFHTIHLVRDIGKARPLGDLLKKKSQESVKESRLLWHIAFPAILTAVFQFSISFATVSFAGHIGEVDLAAITVVENVIEGFAYGVLAMDLAGKAARDNKKTRIVSRHIQLDMQNDEELIKLLGSFTCIGLHEF